VCCYRKYIGLKTKAQPFLAALLFARSAIFVVCQVLLSATSQRDCAGKQCLIVADHTVTAI
jgi:hypothetical protein